MAFVSLSTANLPDPVIDPAAGQEASDHFNTITWTGNTATSRAYTGVGFQPDWLWSKSRSATRSHALFDSVRGVTKYLAADSSASELSSPSSGFLSSFDADGFTATEGSSNFANLNNNGETYVGWLWKAGGTAVSNTDGSITSSVSANTTAGMSLVGFTGTGADATVGHGLNQKPEMFWIKNRDRSAQWSVYHKELGATKFVELSTTAAAASDEPTFNNTEPTATVFSVGAGSNGTNASGEDLIACCFHSVDGFSSIGSYSGNGSSDGPFIYTGFKVKWLMIKNADFAEIWPMFDDQRDVDNQVENPVYANLSSAEGTASTRGVDFLSNGFKIRGTDTSVNRSGDTHIYMAFAETPFRYATAR